MDKVIIESSFLNTLFKCPLCSQLIHSVTVIDECLHRFCELCIKNYFEKNDNKTCPVCQTNLVNPLQTLKSDLIFQRLLYKIFQDKIACKSTNDSTSIQINRKMNVYLEYWDISLDLFPSESLNCYLECIANTTLKSIEKFLRIKYSISSILKIEFFYQSFLLDTNHERLIDICYCFDNQISLVNLRFIISPYGYKAILKHIHSSSPSIDSTIKVKICRTQNSNNDWFIPQSTPSIQLPDLINSCKKKSKPRRRIRFIPTMVNIPPSIFDCLSTNNIKQTFLTEKLICTVPAYISDNNPLDLSLK